MIIYNDLPFAMFKLQKMDEVVLVICYGVAIFTLLNYRLV